MGLKFRWGVFKGARGGGFGMGRFKRGADVEHNHNFDQTAEFYGILQEFQNKF